MRISLDLRHTVGMSMQGKAAVLIYGDGSGNKSVFALGEKLFSYDPITPELSSSGRYSGGTSIHNAPLNDADVDAIMEIVEKLQKQVRGGTRSMGSHLFKFNEQLWILPMQSELGEAATTIRDCIRNRNRES